MENDENFDLAKLMELRDEMLASSSAADKHMEESDRLFRARNDAEHAFSVYARGGQRALDEFKQSVAEIAEQDRAYKRAILNSGCGAGSVYNPAIGLSPAVQNKGRLS